MRNLVELQLDWEPAKVIDAVEACNRCGLCRTQSPDKRMCPLFRIAPSEEASPRAKANMIRGVLSGAVDLDQLTSEEFKDIADLCVHCHACRLECPAGVDIPRIMRESKGAYVAANGLTVAQWAMTRLDLLGALGSLASPATNWAFGNRQMRWLLEKTLGIAQGRKLPRVASRSFMRRAARRRLTRPVRRSGQKVLYFVDLYANYFDPQLAECLVAVLEHNGVGVYVHPDQKPAGMPSIALGALDHARLLGPSQHDNSRRIGAAGLFDHRQRAGGRALPETRVSATSRRRRRESSSPTTAAKPAPSSGKCTRWENCSWISSRCTSRSAIIRPAT